MCTSLPPLLTKKECWLAFTSNPEEGFVLQTQQREMDEPPVEKQTKRQMPGTKWNIQINYRKHKILLFSFASVGIGSFPSLWILLEPLILVLTVSKIIPAVLLARVAIWPLLLCWPHQSNPWQQGWNLAKILLKVQLWCSGLLQGNEKRCSSPPPLIDAWNLSPLPLSSPPSHSSLLYQIEFL